MILSSYGSRLQLPAVKRESVQPPQDGSGCFCRLAPTDPRTCLRTPPLQPPPGDVVAGAPPGFEDREPYFIFRSIRSEVEAALLRDIATLWVMVHEKGAQAASMDHAAFPVPLVDCLAASRGCCCDQYADQYAAPF